MKKFHYKGKIDYYVFNTSTDNLEVYLADSVAKEAHTVGREWKEFTPIFNMIVHAHDTKKEIEITYSENGNFKEIFVY